VPAQQGPRSDDQPQLAEPASGQQPGQRSQDGAIGSRQPWVLDLPLKDGNLVPKDQDLRGLGAIGAGEQGEPPEQAQHRQVGEP
jgi:hypothetical protein